jgi:hypothetical protein
LCICNRKRASDGSTDEKRLKRVRRGLLSKFFPRRTSGVSQASTETS